MDPSMSTNLPPVHTLPDEILNEIFALALPNDPKKQHVFARAVSQACRRWNVVACHQSALWTTFIPRWPPAYQDICLARARTRELTLVLDKRDLDGKNAYDTVIRSPHIQARFGSLVIVGGEAVELHRIIQHAVSLKTVRVPILSDSSLVHLLPSKITTLRTAIYSLCDRRDALSALTNLHLELHFSRAMDICGLLFHTPKLKHLSLLEAFHLWPSSRLRSESLSSLVIADISIMALGRIHLLTFPQLSFLGLFGDPLTLDMFATLPEKDKLRTFFKAHLRLSGLELMLLLPALSVFIDVLNPLNREIFPNLNYLALAIVEPPCSDDYSMVPALGGRDAGCSGGWLMPFIETGFLEPSPEGSTSLRRLAVDIITAEERELLRERVREVVIDPDPAKKWTQSYW